MRTEFAPLLPDPLELGSRGEIGAQLPAQADAEGSLLVEAEDLRVVEAEEAAHHGVEGLEEGLLGREDQIGPTPAGQVLARAPARPFLLGEDEAHHARLHLLRADPFRVDAHGSDGAALGDGRRGEALRVGDGADETGRPAGAAIRFGGEIDRGQAVGLHGHAGAVASRGEIAHALRAGAVHRRALDGGELLGSETLARLPVGDPQGLETVSHARNDSTVPGVSHGEGVPRAEAPVMNRPHPVPSSREERMPSMHGKHVLLALSLGLGLVAQATAGPPPRASPEAARRATGP